MLTELENYVYGLNNNLQAIGIKICTIKFMNQKIIITEPTNGMFM